MVENVTNKEFCIILKLDLNVVECHFCVFSMDYKNAWNEWKVLLDAAISNFAWFYCVLIPSILLTSSCERKLPLLAVA